MHTIINEPYAIAGKGTDKEIRDVNRLVAVYGSDATEWKKGRQNKKQKIPNLISTGMNAMMKKLSNQK